MKDDRPRAGQKGDAEDTVLQRTQDGYVETSVEDIPLSDAAGEGRLRRGEPEEPGKKER